MNNCKSGMNSGMTVQTDYQFWIKFRSTFGIEKIRLHLVCHCHEFGPHYLQTEHSLHGPVVLNVTGSVPQQDIP